MAQKLTHDHGCGHWSTEASERGILFGMKFGKLLIARSRGKLVGTLRLTTKKPWAIDVAYFTPVKKALYLLDMAVAPAEQRQGIGRQLMEQARVMARDWLAYAIRLDAYDASAGAGGFYAKCGYNEVGRVVYRKTPLIYYEFVL